MDAYTKHLTYNKSPGGVRLVNKAEAGVPQINHNYQSNKPKSIAASSQVVGGDTETWTVP